MQIRFVRPAKKNQKLDEHIVGVERHCGRIAHDLPMFTEHLGRISRIKKLTARSTGKFAWQNKAFDLASSVRGRTAAEGFFGINMTSTGGGKTLGNGRIMYALADPERGARFTIALGLRTLTLQTGDMYRTHLGLDDGALAVLVGGAGVRALHELHPEEDPSGESAEPLLDEGSYVHFESVVDAGPLGEWLSHTQGAAPLVHAPVLACTIDHLMPATECLRGGRQIAPMLRLMSSDLVLDEPDDFDIEDLYALSRLVHWAGMLGSRVLLSSATLPPAMVQGLFDAYRSGRRIYRKNRGETGIDAPVLCAWFDEFDSEAGSHKDIASFAEQHESFVNKRIAGLAEETVRRKVEIVPFEAEAEKDIPVNLSSIIHEQAARLHAVNHTVDPKTKKRVSFGIVRMAHIDPLIDTYRELAQRDVQDGMRMHISCYHAKFPLILRAAIESRLDALLQRGKGDDALFDDPDIRTTLDGANEDDHVFIILATAVAEVGRDHDYDWAIVEPSSMRSIIQLAGRVRRHRPEAWDAVNIVLLSTNVAHRMKPGGVAFAGPGFESKDFCLESHDLNELLRDEQLSPLNSAPRIKERETFDPRNNLADLEHERLQALFLGDDRARERIPSANRWWKMDLVHLNGQMQIKHPFRAGEPTETYVYLPDDDEEKYEFHRFDKDERVSKQGHMFESPPSLLWGQRMCPWIDTDYAEHTERLAERLGMSLRECAMKFGTVDLAKNGRNWQFDETTGFRRVK